MSTGTVQYVTAPTAADCVDGKHCNYVNAYLLLNDFIIA